MFISIIREAKKITLTYKVGKEIATINIDEIAFMKNNKRVITIYKWNASDNCITLFNKFYSTIEDVMKKIPNESFVHCERSHIINLDYVDDVLNNSFMLIDNEKTTIPISRAKRKVMKSIFRNHKNT